MSTSRYTSPVSSYDVPSMPYMPPQNLTAEAVAALPPPGMIFHFLPSAGISVKASHFSFFVIRFVGPIRFGVWTQKEKLW